MTLQRGKLGTFHIHLNPPFFIMFCLHFVLCKFLAQEKILNEILECSANQMIALVFVMFRIKTDRSM